MADNLQTIESQVAEIYISTFGRAPDAEGLAYWTSQVLQGALNVAQVNQSFFDQQETQALYGNASNEQFLSSVYKNVLGRDADQAGFDYWLAEFESGQHTQDTFIQTMIAGAKGDQADPNDALLLQNKVNTGLLYAKEVGVANSDLAKQIMHNVTSDASTAENAMGLINYYQGWVSEYSSALGDTVGVTDADLWANINDTSYWQNLEQEHTLNFATQPPVNFWEKAESFWNEGETPEEEFGFLHDETVWHDPTKFLSFEEGEFREVDPETMFSKYAEKAADMYSDLIQNNMDAGVMNTMFDGMDSGMQGALAKNMFDGLEDDKFTGIMGNVGADGMAFMKDLPEFDMATKFESMDDQFMADMMAKLGSQGMAVMQELPEFDMGTKFSAMDQQYMAQMMEGVGADGMGILDELPEFDMGAVMGGMDDQYMAQMMDGIGTEGMTFLNKLPDFDMSAKIKGMDDQFMAQMMGEVGADGLAFFNELPDFDMANEIAGLDGAFMADMMGKVGTDGLNFFNDLADFDMAGTMNGLPPEFIGDLDNFFEGGEFKLPPLPDGGFPPIEDGKDFPEFPEFPEGEHPEFPEGEDFPDLKPDDGEGVPPPPDDGGTPPPPPPPGDPLPLIYTLLLETYFASDDSVTITGVPISDIDVF